MKDNNKTKKWSLVVLLIGPIIGVLLGLLIIFNALQYWNRIELPIVVSKIVHIGFEGNIVWVESDHGELYSVDVRCTTSPCWEKTTVSPNLSERAAWAERFQVFIGQNCSFEHFTYPFFRNVKMCAKANTPFPEGVSWLYLILDDTGTLWSWSGGSSSLMYITCLVFPAIFTIIGIVLSIFVFKINHFTERKRDY
jgi:hypothetical protein